MTTTEELQQLSRDAAGCLPITQGEFFRNEKAGFIVNGATGFVEHSLPEEWGEWLHESTEACGEIFARVLLPDYPTSLDMIACAIALAVAQGEDRVQALRTAILECALVALKGKL